MSADPLDQFFAKAGVSAEDVGEAEATGALPALVLEHLLQPEPPVYDIEELAGQAGVDVDQVGRVLRAMGFPDPSPGERIAGETDVEVLKWAHDRLSDEAAFARTLQQLRVMSSSLERMAEVAADRISDDMLALRAEGVGERELARIALETTDFDHIQRLVSHLYRLQVLAALRRRMTATDPSGLREQLAVGFVDMAGFTAISQELEPLELAAMVDDFESRAQGTIAEEGARLVKSIGDEVMFSTPLPAAAVRVALRLADDPRRGPNTPDVRAGVAYGPVIARYGDEFGPVVNLASRLVGIAYPGSVIVSEEVHDAISDEPGLHWRALKPRRLKGIGRVPSWVVRLQSE